MKVEKYIKKQKLTLHLFSKMCGVEWSCFFRGYKSKYIALWLAKRIVDTSNGMVRYEDLLTHRPKSIRKKMSVTKTK